MLSLDQLCAKYDNEDIHTEHVTALAVQLFDATRRWLGLPRADRRLLIAAARLHDIGYRVDPPQHPSVSRTIVRRAGLTGFRAEQRRLIADIIPLHSGDWDQAVHRLPHRVLALGALLRVADGLDNGHIQDARIVNVERTAGIIRVAVHSPHFPFNVIKADRKADLWRKVFPVDIRFAAASGPGEPLLRPDLPVAEAARRLMSLQLKTIAINVDGVIDDTDPRALHDVRVAVRRLRLLLDVFSKRLPPSSRRSIDVALRELNHSLSPVRDLGVWMAYWEDPAVQRALARNRLWQTFVPYQQQRRRAQLAAARRGLRSAAFTTARAQMIRLLRTELPRRARLEPPGNLPRRAARKWKKTWRRALELGRLRHAAAPEEIHRLRRALRQARYLGEFFGPLLGLEKLTRRIHAAERALAQIHDVDVALAHNRETGLNPPRVLLAQLRERRRQGVKQSETAWQRLTAPAFQRRAKRAFKTAIG